MEALIAVWAFVALIFVLMAIDRWNARHPRHSHKAR